MSAPRSRIELRATPEFLARVNATAKRFGLTASSFIRLATCRLMDARPGDPLSATDPFAGQSPVTLREVAGRNAERKDRVG
jgi:hypothetical protein